MQLDAFPDTRCPRELALLERGEYRALERAYRDAAETALGNPGLSDKERNRLHQKFTDEANRLAGEIMNRELPWDEV